MKIPSVQRHEASKSKSAKEHPSADEIREKFMAHKKSKEQPAAKVELSEQAQKPKVKEKELIGGQLGSNDPTDPDTVNKIQDALDMSFVNFSPKEREVLQKIMQK